MSRSDRGRREERDVQAQEIDGAHAKTAAFAGELAALAQSPETPLLIEGAGARDVAWKLHRLTFRVARAPFVEVDCTWLPSRSLATFLFGEERDGRVRRGLVEKADGGTLFLDDIAELPSQEQARFSKFLDRMRFRREGGSVDVAVQVRVIGSVRSGLERLLATGRLRRDLHARLSVVPLVIA